MASDRNSVTERGSERHGDNPLRSLVDAWNGKAELAKKARKSFDDVTAQCTDFFAGTTGFMWKSGYMQKYFGGALPSRFKITICKAFEFVAQYGPNLYWENPQRKMEAIAKEQYTWEDFLPEGWQPPPPPELPPPPPEDAPPEIQQQYQQMQEMANQPPPEVQQAQQMFQQADWNSQRRQRADDLRCRLYENWLNYTPREQPGGGLSRHSQLALIDAMVTGRGIIRPRHYRMPGSQRNLTGGFWVPQKDQWFDPDASSHDDAYWMFIEEWKPYWELERMFGHKPDSLKKYATQESSNSRGERSSDVLNRVHRAQGKTNDMMRVYHIWSKMGVGARLSGVKVNLRDELEPVVGDYAYICISPNCPFPLNCPNQALDEDDESIGRRFRWDTPYWMDDKWPVSFIEFYPRPGSPYPIAPLMPGLGELSYINIFISHLAGRIWSSSRDFIVLLEHVAKFVEKDLRGGDDMCIIKVPSMVKNVSESVQFLQQPEVRADAWRIVNLLSEQFERRVGLQPSIYGQTDGAQERSATDSRQKMQAATVRMKYMQAQVAKWQAEVADMEKVEARFHVEAEDVRERMGEVGEFFWTKYITDQDPELVMREMRATVEASSLRMPNKEKEVEDIQGLMQVAFAEFSKHADMTGDTRAMNALIRTWHDAMDIELDPEMALGQRIPQPPPPEQAQMMEQQSQVEMAKVQAEIQKIQADAQVKQMEVQLKQMELQYGPMEAQMEQQKAMQDMQMDQQRNQEKLMLNRIKHQEKMQMQREKDQASIQADQVKTQMKLQGDMQKQRMNQEIERERAMQQMTQEQISGAHKMSQQARQAELQVGMQHEKHKMQMAQMAARPNKKPASNGKA